MSQFDTRLGKRLRMARGAAGLSQRDVARQLGMSFVNYGDFERGKVQVSLDYLPLLSRILGRSIAYLLGLDTGLAEDADSLLTHYRAIKERSVKYLVLQTAKTAAQITREED